MLHCTLRGGVAGDRIRRRARRAQFYRYISDASDVKRDSQNAAFAAAAAAGLAVRRLRLPASASAGSRPAALPRAAGRRLRARHIHCVQNRFFPSFSALRGDDDRRKFSVRRRGIRGAELFRRAGDLSEKRRGISRPEFYDSGDYRRRLLRSCQRGFPFSYARAAEGSAVYNARSDRKNGIYRPCSVRHWQSALPASRRRSRGTTRGRA